MDGAIKKNVMQISKIAFKALLLWVGATIVLLAYLFPQHPKSLIGWRLFFIFSVPMLVVGELIAHSIFENRFAKKLEDKTAGQSFSPVRIIYFVVAFFAWFAILWGCIRLFNLSDFFDLLFD